MGQLGPQNRRATPPIFRSSQSVRRLTPLAVRTLVSFGLAVVAVGHGGGLRGGAGATTVFLFHGGGVGDGALVAVVIWTQKERQKIKFLFDWSVCC